MTSPRRTSTGAFAGLAALGSVVACLWFTDLTFSHTARLSFWKVYAGRLTLLALAALLLLISFVQTVVRRPRRAGVRHALTSSFAITSLLLLLEVVFMFVPMSHNVGYTLAARVWYQWYWGPQNSLGCRDREPVPVPGRRSVLVVGDSFTAAQGINRREQRFTERLAAARPDLDIVNLGKCGADCVSELDTLIACRAEADVIVLQYYVNDIEGTAQRLGRTLPPFEPYADLPPGLAFVVRNSFLLDFFYWRRPHGDERAYVDFLAAMAADDEVLRVHLGELDRLADLAAERKVPLVAVVFPALLDLDLDAALLTRVRERLTARGATVVDVAPLVRDLAPAQRTSNPQDAHASAIVHDRVGAALAAAIPGR